MKINYATLDVLEKLSTSNTKIAESGKELKNTIPTQDGLIGNPGKVSLIPTHVVDYDVYQIGYGGYYDYHYGNSKWTDKYRSKIDSCPLFYLLKSDSHEIDHIKQNIRCKALAQTITKIALVYIDDSRQHNIDHYQSNNSWAWGTDWYTYRNCNFDLVLEITPIDSDPFCIITTFTLAKKLFGITLNNNFEFTIEDKVFSIDYKKVLKNCYSKGYSYYNKSNHNPNSFDYTLEAVNLLLSGPFQVGNEQCDSLVRAIANKKYPVSNIKPEGISKTYNKLIPLFDELLKKDPVVLCALRTLAMASKFTIESVKTSTVFNELFGKTTTSDEIIKIIREFWLDAKNINIYRDTHGFINYTDALKNIPQWKEKRKSAIKSQGNKAFGKLMQEFEFLNLDEEKYPITSSTIKNGELPLGTFFRKNEQYFLLNDNWQLWEEMLAKYPQQAIELANEVKGRTTYEKDLMSYFYFVLHALPEYLEEQTNKKWICKPKLVNTENELEPPAADDATGIVRKRSALTPLVDNDNCTVEVPYASLAIGGGYGTTYCYSHDYHVLTKGFSFNGNAVMNNVEEKLNGKDDYGLMFYTLTGSAQGRGYPTFLIIFERRNQKGDVKVHFHRTHPTRSKNGDYNPIHRWVTVCYNWMAGNINRKLIKAQQGDLFFVEVDSKLAFDHKVNAYDKHTFEVAVDFAEYDKAVKSNILGYVRLESETMLKHTEHDDVKIPAGEYAIHQCRSWEANPKGVWSLRVD